MMGLPGIILTQRARHFKEDRLRILIGFAVSSLRIKSQSTKIREREAEKSLKDFPCFALFDRYSIVLNRLKKYDLPIFFLY